MIEIIKNMLYGYKIINEYFVSNGITKQNHAKMNCMHAYFKYYDIQTNAYFIYNSLRPTKIDKILKNHKNMRSNYNIF